MSAAILDGKELAKKLLAQISAQVSSRSSTSKKLGLATVLVGDDAASKSYVAGKHRDCAEVGISSIKVELDKNASKSQLLDQISKLNSDTNCTGFLVQLPLPNSFAVTEILAKISPEKDVDGLTPENLGLLALGKPRVIPCTARAIQYLLQHYRIDIAGRQVLIIGRGMTVGRPLSILLSSKENNATVTLAHSASKDLPQLIAKNDVVITAVGKPNWLKSDWVKSDATIIDVGITKLADKLVGDCDEKVVQNCKFYAPVPGGVGPLTRAMLMQNLLDLDAAE